MKMFTNSLRHKIILEQETQTDDGAGGFTTAWETVATLWASITRVRGTEAYAHGQLTARATHIFRMRYNAGVTADKRFTFDNRPYNIRALHNPSQKNHILEVWVEEGVV